MKLLRRILIFIATAFIAFLVYIQNQDFNNYKDKIIQLIRSATNCEVKINGDVQLRFLPYIKLRVNDIELVKPNIANLRGDIDFSFILNQLLRGKFNINSLTINKAKVTYQTTKSSYQDAFQQVFNNLTIESISFTDSDFVYINNDSLIREYENIDLDLILKPNDVSFLTTFLVNDLSFTAKGNLQKTSQSSFNLNNLTLSSNYIDAIISTDQNSVGNLNVKIKDLTKFSDSFLSDYLNSFILVSKEMVNLTANFSIKDAQYLNITNLNIASDNIKLRGGLELNLQNNSFKRINLNIDSIDCDKLIERSSRRNFNGNSIMDLQFDESGDNGFSLEIKNLIYNQQSLSNIKISGQSQAGKITLDPIILQLPFNSKLELVGGFNNNKYRNAFEGEVLVIGESVEKVLSWLYQGFNRINDSKYIFRSTVYLTPLEFSLNDINFTANNSSISGNISKKSSNEVEKISLDLTINNLDFDKFFPSDKWLKGFASFRKGLAEDNYLLRFQNIRNFSYQVRGQMIFNNARFNNIGIDRLETYLHMKPGNIELRDLKFAANQLDMAGKIKIAIEDLKPALELKLEGNSLDLNQAAKFLNSELSSNMEDYRLDRFNGTVDLNFKTIVIDKERLSNVVVSGKLDSNRINLVHSKMELWGGSITLLGYLTPQDKNFGISFGLSNIEGGNLFQLLFKQKTLSGPISVGGSIYSSKKDNDWISNLNSTFSMVGRGINVSGMDFQSIVDFSRERNIYDQATFDRVINNALSGGVSNFDKLDGSFKINNGILQTNSLVFASKALTGAVAGSFDLKNRLMNMASKINFIPRAGAKPTPIILKVKGNFDNPEKTLDSKNLSDFLKSN